MIDLVERAALAAAAELRRQAEEPVADTPYVDDAELAEAVIDGRVNLLLAVHAAIEVALDHYQTVLLDSSEAIQLVPSRKVRLGLCSLIAHSLPPPSGRGAAA